MRLELLPGGEASRPPAPVRCCGLFTADLEDPGQMVCTAGISDQSLRSVRFPVCVSTGEVLPVSFIILKQLALLQVHSSLTIVTSKRIVT